MEIAERKPRNCQPCTACCDGWLTTTVLGHTVRPGQPCPYSTGAGCSTYSSRPENPCRSFFCAWIRQDSPLPDWMRPSQCGAIVFLWYDWRGQKVINAVPVGREIPERTLDWLKDYAQKQGRPLLYVERLERTGEYVGVRCIGFGPASFRKEVAKLRLQSEGAELIAMYSGLREAANPKA